MLFRSTAGSDALGQPAVTPDPTRSAPGRGAHLHPTTGCYDLAVRRKAFGRALRVPAGLSTAPVAQHLHDDGSSTTRTSGAPQQTISTDKDWSSSS